MPAIVFKEVLPQVMMGKLLESRLLFQTCRSRVRQKWPDTMWPNFLSSGGVGGALGRDALESPIIRYLLFHVQSP